MTHFTLIEKKEILDQLNSALKIKDDSEQYAEVIMNEFCHDCDDYELSSSKTESGHTELITIARPATQEEVESFCAFNMIEGDEKEEMLANIEGA